MDKNDYFNILLPFEPVPRQEPTQGKYGTYSHPKTAQFQKSIKFYLRAHYPKAKPLEGPILLTIIFLITRPKSVSEKTRPYPHKKPDLSNLIKNLEDAMNGLIFNDDAQIVNLNCIKRYAPKGSKGCIRFFATPWDPTKNNNW